MTDYYISRDQECIVVELEDLNRWTPLLSVTLTPTEWGAFVNEGNTIRDAIESGADDPDLAHDLAGDR